MLDQASRDFVVDLGFDRPASPATRLAAARQIGQACATYGFFVAVGHGVQPAKISDLRHAASKFFDEPDERKDALGADPRDPLQRGFSRGDLEVYSMSRLGEPSWPGEERSGDPVLFMSNKWPSDAFGLREACLAYYAAAEGLAAEIMRLAALALELPEDWFAGKFNNHMTQLAINHYQPTDTGSTEREFRNNPHQDWGTITLLHQTDSYGGLQVLGHEGEWLDIPSNPDSFIVQIGDLMARWTNERWVSAVHRVAKPPREYAHQDRMSLSFFYQPNADTLIECIPTCATHDDPPRYPPVSTYDYISAKVRRAYVVGRLAKRGQTEQDVGGVKLRPLDPRRPRSA